MIEFWDDRHMLRRYATDTRCEIRVRKITGEYDRIDRLR